MSSHLKVELPGQLKDYVESKVAAGHYVDGADFVRDMLRERHKAEEELHELLMQGEASGHSERTVEEVIADARSRWLAHRAEQGG